MKVKRFSAYQPNEVTLNIPAYRRVIVSEDVLLQPGLAVIDLARKAQLVSERASGPT
jgi:hypothetical protein